MYWDDDDRRRRARNYRLMFRSALSCLLLAVLITVAGGVRAVATADPLLLVYGLLLFIWSSGSAYLTVDSMVEELNWHPDLIKIDVEGEELATLHGMSGVLRARPTLFIEGHGPRWGHGRPCCR